MADEQDNKGPKDVTPNPLEEAEKKQQAEPPADGAQAAPQAQAEGQPQAEPAKEQPEEPPKPKTFKEIFLDSQTWNRIGEVALIVAGCFFLVLSLSLKAFMPIPAIIGSLLLALAAFFDGYLLKKFQKDAGKLQLTLRYILTGVFVVLAVVFAIQIAKPWARDLDDKMIMAAFLVIVLIVVLNFALYLKKNKNAALSDIYLFISLILLAVAFAIFRFFYVIPAMILAFAGAVLLAMSLSKEPLRKDENFPLKIMGILLILLFMAPILYYSLTIFFTQQAQVMEYTTVSPEYKSKPENLAWAGNDKSLAFNNYSEKKKSGVISIINAYSAGTVDIPPEGDTVLKFPAYIDAPQWNKASNFIILTAGDSEVGARNIWGISLALSKMQKENKSKNNDNNDKILVSDVKKIIDVECMPITHKTAWSSESKNFVFAAKTKNKGDFNIWTSDINKQSITQITKGARKIFPLWSPAEAKILYVTKTDSYPYFKVSNYDGSNAHEFSLSRKSDRELLPCWDPHEAKVIFHKGDELMIMNANATQKSKLTRNTFVVRDYWLTPERRKIRLTYTETGIIWRVWTIEKNGKHNKEIFKQACDGFSQPKWSYDGDSIALSASYGKLNSIWLLGKNGEMPIKIYSTEGEISVIEWAPSSKKMAFLVKKYLTQELWVINRDGSKPKMLFSSFGKINNITWDNDDKRIAFDETFHYPLFVNDLTTTRIVYAKTGQLLCLLPYNFYSEYPSWSEKGDMIAYVGWKDIRLKSSTYKIWIARLQ